MIDEYQDTNRSQYELMRLLTEAHKNICVVGDEDQSIYGWRGADIRNILDFEHDFPNAAVIRLEQNYRSTKNILEAASAVVANNTERKGKWLWTEAGAGEKIGRFEAFDGEQEALFIADMIDKLLTANPGDRAAVLYRTNFQSRQIEEALRRYNRDYVVLGGFSFYQRAEVKDALAYLKAVISPQDSVSLLRIINTPARGIGKSTIEQIEQYALQNQLSVWSAIGRMLDEKVFPARAESALRHLQKHDGRAGRCWPRKPKWTICCGRSWNAPVTRRMLAGRQRSGIRIALRQLERTGECRVGSGRTRREHRRISGSCGSGFRHRPTGRTRAQSRCSRCTTPKAWSFRSSSWPEWKRACSRTFASLDSKAAMEEERRLCYVGMTRSEKRLFLTSARYRRRFGGGQQEATIPSRFLREVPRALVEDLSQSRAAHARRWICTPNNTKCAKRAKRNLYTGKTYNSVENIQQFFNERGKAPAPLPQPASQPQSASPANPQARRANAGGAAARTAEAGLPRRRHDPPSQIWARNGAASRRRRRGC